MVMVMGMVIVMVMVTVGDGDGDGNGDGGTCCRESRGTLRNQAVRLQPGDRHES